MAMLLCGQTLIFIPICLSFRILLTMPVGSVPCERFFSAVRRLYHWGRSTITENRLVGLALLFVHRQQMVSVDNILTKFANSKKRRIGPLKFWSKTTIKIEMFINLKYVRSFILLNTVVYNFCIIKNSKIEYTTTVFQFFNFFSFKKLYTTILWIDTGLKCKIAKLRAGQWVFSHSKTPKFIFRRGEVASPPWTPTRALPWTHWGPQAAPRTLSQ